VKWDSHGGQISAFRPTLMLALARTGVGGGLTGQ
jgi:hypothetical protein